MNKININVTVCGIFIFFGAAIDPALSVINGRALPAQFQNPFSLSIVLVFLLVLAYSVSLIPLGGYTERQVKTFNTLCAIKTLDWDAIERCKYINILGLKYLLLYSNSSRLALWLPLNIKKFDELKQTLEQKIDNRLVKQEFLKAT